MKMKRSFWKILVNIIIGFSGIVYLFALYYFTIGKIPYLPGLTGNLHLANFVPFKTIAEYISFVGQGGAKRRIAIVNLIGNLILTVPLAIYLPFFIKHLRSLWKTMSISLLVILAIEFYQLISGRGSFDVDDIILNLLGATAGYGIWKTRPAQWITARIQLDTSS